MHDHLLACFAFLGCLLVGLSCQLCLPTSLLLVGWFFLLYTTIFWLVLPFLAACWLAYLASYACLLAACWLADFTSYA
jgi:hypothetical protein